MNNKNVRKILSVILGTLLILLSGFAIIMNITKQDITEAGLTEYVAKYANVNYNYVDSSYTKPNITADDIIKTAAKYLGDPYDNGVGNGKLYGDAYTDNGSTKSNVNKGTTLNKVGTPDCSGLVYATLRQLGVKLSGFDDNSGTAGKQLGPVPVNTQGWVKRDWSNISNSQAYNIKWLNGNDINIINYQTKGQTTVNGNVMNSYANFINYNNIAKGSIIVTLNPDTSGENHMWVYIGQYNNVDAVKSYLHSIGITNKDSYISVSGTGTYWSIECNGSQGVVITNRDPAAAYGDKAGSGYAAFTLVDVQTKDINIKIDKEDMDGHDLSGATFNYWNQGETFSNPPSGTAQATGTSFTIKDMEYGSDQYIWLQETRAPTGYKIGLKNPIALKVSVNNNGTVSVSKVHDGGNPESDMREYYSGVGVSGNSITVKIKDPKDTIDVPVKILKTTEDGTIVNGAVIKYWVYDNISDRPTGKEATATQETSIGECTHTIEKMEYGTTKYVWITETASSPFTELGYFDTPDNKTNYIALKVSVDDNGKITVGKRNSLGYLVSLYTDRLGEFYGGNSKYIDTDNIKVNGGTIEVPIVNPETSYEYDIYIGKKSTKAGESKGEEDLMGGAKFSIISAVGSSVETTLDSLNGDTAKSGWITTKDKEYSSLSKDATDDAGELISVAQTEVSLTDALTGSHIYQITEETAPEGYKLPDQKTYYLRVSFDGPHMAQYKEMKIEGIKVYCSLNNEAYGGNLDEPLTLNEEENNETGIKKYTDDDNKIAVYLTKDQNGDYNQVYFIMKDEPIEGNYNLNIAKVDKELLDENEDSDIVGSYYFDESTMAGAVFDIEQHLSRGTRGVNTKENFTTNGNGYDEVYSDVEIEGTNIEDIYYITEKESPEGYDVYNHTIRVIVKKSIRTNIYGDYYSIGDVEITVDTDDDGDYDDEETVTLLEKDATESSKVHTRVNDNLYVRSRPDTGEITLVVGDYKLEGQYKMNIVKKELKDTNTDNYESEEATYQNGLADAEYTIEKRINQSETAESISVTTVAENKKEFTEVTITDTEKYDSYIITEEDAPDGLNIEKMQIEANVYKDVDTVNHKYIVSKVEIKTLIGDSTINVGETLYIGEAAIQKTYFANYIIAVQLIQNAVGDYDITFTWRNDRTSYNISLLKTDSSYNPITDAAEFSVNLYSDKELNNIVNLTNLNGEVINGDSLYTENGYLNITDIKVEENQLEKTYYLAIEEITPPAGKVKIDGKLIIPIQFTRNLDGDIEVKYNEDAYLLKDNTEIAISETSINLYYFDNNFSITYPNVSYVEFSFTLYKFGQNTYGSTNGFLPGGEFAITITRKETNEIIYQSTQANPDITNERGKITIQGLTMTKDSEEFEINIIETKAPEGYLIAEEYAAPAGRTIQVASTTDGSGNLVLNTEASAQENVTIFNNTINIRVLEPEKGEEGKYELKLIKYGKDETIPLEGVQFQLIGGHINGMNLKDNMGTNDISESNPWDIDETASEPVNIWRQITMNKTYIEDPDTYTIRETSIGNNTGYYIGIKDSIKVTIDKKTEQTEERIINKIKAVTLQIGNDNPVTLNYENGETTKTITKDELDVVITLKQDSADETNTIIEISVENPKETTEISKEKRWENVTNANLYKVQMRLYKGGTATDQIKEVIGNGTATFDNLEKYDEAGQEIVYTVQEEKAQYRTSETSSEWIDLVKGQDYVADEENGVFVNTIPQESGEYNVNLVKKGIDGPQLGGVQFTASAQINGSEQTLYTEQNPLTTSETEAVIVKDNVVINKDQVNTPDTYTLKEINIGNNNEYYIGITQDIILTVNKKSETSADGKTITNSVSGITLAIEGANVTKESETKSTAKITTEDGQEVEVIAELLGNTITLTVENPEIITGQYSVSIQKIDNDTKNGLRGATFTVNGEKVGPTTGNGLVIVESKIEINAENVNITDEYEITEVSVEGNNYEVMNGSLKILVTKKQENTEYKLDLVEIEGGTIQNGVSTKTITLTDGTTVEATARISGSIVRITIPNKPKNGSYKIELIKYGKQTDGTLTVLPGVTFNLIGGTVNNSQISNMQGIISEDNPIEIITETEPVDIWGIDRVNIVNTEVPDTYTLKEANLGDNVNYKIGFDEPITITINKTEDYTVGSVELSINGTKVQTTDNEGNPTYTKTADNGQQISVTVKLENGVVSLTVENPEKTGTFDLNLIKYVQGTTIPLQGAGFTVSIKDEQGTELADTSKTYTTGEDGNLTEKVSGIKIEGVGKTYTVTVIETVVPKGYEGIEGAIKFGVVSKLSDDGESYILTTEDSTTVANAKKVTIGEDEVLIEAENKPEGPHKGVKEVNNQNSGYYDEVTGSVYTSEEEIESTIHDWVVTVRIPESINNYNKYIITDTIDERLEFSGIENVKVKILDGETLEEKQELVKDTDYQVTYDEQTRTLKVSFIEGEFVEGKTLPVGDIIEIRFNTTFAKDEDGNIIAINQSIPNQAILTYGDNQGNEVSQKTETPEVHTGGVGIYKYDEKTGNALQGAKFKIATSKENAENGIFVKDANGNDIEKETNEKGIAVFEGLEFGEDAMDDAKYQTGEDIYGQPVYQYNWEEMQTTYYIVETESPEGYSKIEEPIEAVVKKDNYDINDITTLIQVGNESNIYDLSLRKFITAVKDGSTGEEEEVTTRIPDVDITELANGTTTTATYTHPKDPVLVHTTDTVTYTIRVYNEGPQDAYASLIKDDIPDGLEFVTYTQGDGSVNDTYRWKLVDENDNEVTDPSQAKYIITDYLSKENEQTEGENLLKAFIPETMAELDYRDVKVQFKVTEPTTSDRILINYAQITEETDSNGTPVTDRDSTPNEWIEGEDDQDIEKVRVLYFDLALRKWVTQAIVTENGQTTVTETGHKAEDDPEEVVKVDLKKSKIEDVTVKFKYSIRITNEGEIAGEATEIRDDIPQGLKFVAEDNPDWREENGQIITNKLAGTTLQPGESAEVEIILTWVNSESNMGVMVNTAEINKDHNDYGTPDIDSTPGNNVPGEDDIDDAPVMLTVKTGTEIIMYTSLGLGFLAIIGAGAMLIKKKVLVR